ncbi:MAG: exodeoxyribonuclease V subunit gamma [Thermoleophilaceae bacterium]|nr:exodeoxyribonuclease V subunit gamma [Thermoleophilaceae bacterium]
MPLRLVTGPANAAKAGAVLGPLRDRLDERGAAQPPILVVPSFEDVDHSRRELADRGAVFGVDVLRFGALFGQIAARAGHHARRASELQRMLIIEEAVRAARLDVLSASAQRPGFARAAARFTAELERSMVEPARLTRALRDWAGDGPRRAYAEEVAEVYRRYREGLDAAGLEDEELYAWRSLEALRGEPRRWGATPVFVYGFDDFTRTELATLEELSEHSGADVTVSLPWEPGREAFRATSTIRQELEERGAVVESLDALSEHYAPGSRKALHALERSLFEEGGCPRSGARSGGVVRLHRAGGERAEVELCGAEVLRMLREGTPPGEIAVVFREPQGYASMVEQVFGSYGIPYSIDRSVPLAHTALGHGILALLRCALLEGTAEDLLAYLRTPGLLTEPRLADRLEAEVRRAGASTAQAARVIWQSTPNRWPLEELDRLAGARDMAACLTELDVRLSRLFAAPYRRRAPVLRGAELDDARAFVAARKALVELRAVITADPRVRLDHQRVHDTLAALPVRVGEEPQPDRVQVASPLSIRARRFCAVIVCGLQEDEFPRRATPEAFLSDADRRDIARASGLRLALREDQLERERYLFYVCASRAERELVLSTRYCDEEGNPQASSFFVDDAREALPDLGEHVRTRSLADVTWPLDEAPTPAEWERAVARAGPRRAPATATALTAEPALREVARKEVVSAGALERFAGCPVKWLVEDLLDPEKLEPDPEQMVRGSYAHRVLELTYRRVRERTGSRRVTPDNLPEAERILVEALRECQGEFRLSPDQVRVRAAVRRLEFDLLRYLRHESGRDGLLEPEHLELRFGFADCEHPAVEIEGGLRVRGVIDRVDVHGSWALVRDYKSGKVESYKAADWEPKNRFQAALYMMVVERLLGLRAAGGVYVPLSGSERRPRGMVAEEALDELGSDFYKNDVKPEHEFAQSTAWAQGAIVDAAERMRTGRIGPCPDSCAYRGGCSHPSICRVEA